MKFKVTIVSALLLAFAVNVKAQIALVDPANGKPYRVSKYEEVSGSPYLLEDWSAGEVKIGKADKFQEAELKFSDIDNKVFFKSPTGEVLEFNEPIAEFNLKFAKNGSLLNIVNRHFVYGLGGAGDRSYYEVIADGKNKFVKQSVKTILKKQEYNSAVAVKSFETNEKYFIYSGDKLITVAKNQKSILAALGNKQTELEAYAKSNKIGFRKDDDIALLFTYYNTL